MTGRSKQGGVRPVLPPAAPEDLSLAMTIQFMPILLRAMLAWSVLHFCVGIPFVFVNKMGALWFGLANVITLLLAPQYLFRTKRIVAAAWMFVLGGSAISGVLVMLSGGLHGQINSQVAITVASTVLLGWRGGLTSAALAVGFDLGIVLFQAGGGQLPRPFPMPPLAQWFQMLSSLILIAPVLAAAVSKTQSSLSQARKQVADLAQSREELLHQQQLLACCGDALIGVDPNRLITFWNPAAERVFGWRSEEVVGQHVEHVGFSLDAERRREMMELGRWNGLLNLSDRSGRFLDVEVSLATLRNADGSFSGVVAAMRDVTMRREMEAALRENEERFSAAFHHAPVLQSISSLKEGRFLEVNETALSVSGFTREELIGKRSVDVGWINPEDRQRISEVLERDGKATGIELTLRRKDGRRMDCLYSGLIISLQREKCLLSISVDITERKRAEEALHSKTEELNRYFDLSRDLLLITTRDGQIRRINAEWKRAFGYLDSQLASISLSDLIHPDDAPSLSRMTALTGADGPIPEILSRIRREDGQYRWVEWRCHAHGDLIYSVGRDVSERQANVQALRDSEETLRLAIESSLLGTFDYCPSAGRSLWSSRTLQLFGLPPSAPLTAERITQAIHPQDLERVRGLIAGTVLREGGSSSTTVECRVTGIEDRIERWVAATISVFQDETGRANRWVGVVKDISSQKAAEKQLHGYIEALKAEKEKAEQATRAKSDFLSTMSHEIRTPMNGIIGMTGLLIDTDLSEIQKDYARTVRHSASSLMSLLNDILDFSKVESGKIELESIPFDLKTAVEDVLELTAPKAHEKGLEIVMHYAAGKPSRFLGDPGRIRQILLNLVSNAVKFTEHGHVLIEVDYQAEGLVSLAVHDTGVGIPEEKQQLLFSRFSQVDSSTTRRHGGSGLGLAIAKQLTHLMGGTLSVASTPGEGSNFYCTLPLAEIERAPQEPSAAAELQNVRVIIAEKRPITRVVLTGLCQSWGMKVTDAATGKETLEAMARMENEGDPCAFLLIGDGDWTVEDQNAGYGPNRRFGKRQLQTVLLSTRPQWRSLPPGIPANIDAILLKPVRCEQLRTTLTQLRRKALAPACSSIGPRHDRAYIDPVTSDADFDGQRILLAEDNPVNQRVACAILSKLGCHVEVASSGADAVHLADQFPFDLILMDCQMPDMDGFEATRAIRSLKGRPSRIPIIALTASAMKEDRDRCISNGMNDYLSKPIDVEDFRTCLSRWLRSDQSSTLVHQSLDQMSD